MSVPLLELILKASHAKHVERAERIQSLWSGYGEIVRLHMSGSHINTAILKHVKPPSEVDHPRGWHSDTSHARKLKSYHIEMYWYKNWAKYCDHHCRVPKCYFSNAHNEEFIMLLEDLDAAGFAIRKDTLNNGEI